MILKTKAKLLTISMTKTIKDFQDKPKSLINFNTKNTTVNTF